jgi:hypothetical protein
MPNTGSNYSVALRAVGTLAGRVYERISMPHGGGHHHDACGRVVAVRMPHGDEHGNTHNAAPAHHHAAWW